MVVCHKVWVNSCRKSFLKVPWLFWLFPVIGCFFIQSCILEFAKQPLAMICHWSTLRTAGQMQATMSREKKCWRRISLSSNNMPLQAWDLYHNTLCNEIILCPIFIYLFTAISFDQSMAISVDTTSQFLECCFFWIFGVLAETRSRLKPKQTAPSSLQMKT